jgi:hypothetical protein
MDVSMVRLWRKAAIRYVDNTRVPPGPLSISNEVVGLDCEERSQRPDDALSTVPEGMQSVIHDLQPTIDKYPATLRLLHWVRAVLTIGLIAAGWAMTVLNDDVTAKFNLLYP